MTFFCPFLNKQRWIWTLAFWLWRTTSPRYWAAGWLEELARPACVISTNYHNTKIYMRSSQVQTWPKLNKRQTRWQIDNEEAKSRTESNSPQSIRQEFLVPSRLRFHGAVFNRSSPSSLSCSRWSLILLSVKFKISLQPKGDPNNSLQK